MDVILNCVQVESKFPGAVASYVRDVSTLERTEFFEEDGFLYAETVAGCLYYWSVEDREWFDS